ncbi:hypothetical protein BJX62DRAFT_124215 [Aspergillus germanicus]
MKGLSSQLLKPRWSCRITFITRTTHVSSHQVGLIIVGVLGSRALALLESPWGWPFTSKPIGYAVGIRSPSFVGFDRPRL